MAGRLNRSVVVDRAAELADEIGLDQVTITRLGRALGIAPPGVYRHVADVTDLRAAVGQRATIELAQVLSAACAGRSGADALSALCTSLRDWAAQHPGRYAAMQIAPAPDDDAAQADATRLLGVLESALRAYDLTGDDLTDGIRLVRATVHGFVCLERDGGFKQPRSPDATFDRIVGMLDAALNGSGIAGRSAGAGVR